MKTYEDKKPFEYRIIYSEVDLWIHCNWPCVQEPLVNSALDKIKQKSLDLTQWNVMFQF